MNGVCLGGGASSDIYNWKEVSQTFTEACKSLELGELLHDEVFGLYDVGFRCSLLGTRSLAKTCIFSRFKTNSQKFYKRKYHSR